MTFTLRWLLLFFVVVWSSMATFGAWGIAVVVLLGIPLLFIHSPAYRASMIVVFGLVWFLGAVTNHSHREAALLMVCDNGLKQIALALHNYHDRCGCFPPAYVADAEGKPMHSWRVLLLPYLEEDSLYQKYRFDEPWDGPNNRALAATSPRCYRCYSTDIAEPGTPHATHYVAITGPGTAWPGAKTTRLKDCRDGASKTIMLVEIAGSDIPWSEPRDVTLEEALSEGDTARRVPSSHHCVGRTYFFFSTYPLVGNVLTMDGRCRCLTRQPSRDELAPRLSIDGGELLETTTASVRRGDTLVDRLDWSRVIGFVVLMVSSLLLASRSRGRGVLPTGSAGAEDS